MYNLINLLSNLLFYYTDLKNAARFYEIPWIHKRTV